MKHVKEIIKEPKKKEAKKSEKKIPYPGLEQEVNGNPLHKIIKPEHTWQIKKQKTVSTIISHKGVQRIADFGGISKMVDYKVVTQPDIYNGRQYTVEAKVCMLKDPQNCANEWGEASTNSVGSRGRNNLANMAEKRAYDRAVFRLLGIEGILSEEELPDEDKDENDMDNLSKDESKIIAPLINQITLSKNKNDLMTFNRNMKEESKKYNAAQLDFLRKYYQKKLAEITKTSF